MQYLGVCAIFRDEDRYIEEWIAYHIHLGVEIFSHYCFRSKQCCPAQHPGGLGLFLLTKQVREACRWGMVKERVGQSLAKYFGRRA